MTTCGRCHHRRESVCSPLGVVDTVHDRHAVTRERIAWTAANPGRDCPNDDGNNPDRTAA